MIEAVVQTGAFETAYRRAGAGRAVLLLGVENSPHGAALFRELAARFRVIAPVLPGGDGHDGEPSDVMGRWLRGLIDGLGLERPALVADAALGPALVRFAALDPDRADRLALVGPDLGPWQDGPLTDAPALEAVWLVRLQDQDDPTTRAGELAGLFEFLARSI
jgi:pimeloyl-ACP methyl ester carboxylesterase